MGANLVNQARSRLTSGTSTASSRAIVRMGRRRFALFISTLLAAAGLAGHVIRGRAATPLDRFLALSTVLTGVGDLARDHAQIYLDCLLARPEQAAALEDLYARAGLAGDAPACTLDELTARGVFADRRLRALADEILLLWYTGEYDAADGRALATYEGSLAWRSLPYASAPGTCGGAMGFWGEPPAG
ncbi:sugar dehydrogenase complex small subunit [Sorangium sp. So ce590]|uniref:sugar dehydrogenase complex small subunit n=1 Tax=Sorangium sp. So ce590 TaxID=3133317 RepID=UPI003F5EA5D6